MSALLIRCDDCLRDRVTPWGHVGRCRKLRRRVRGSHWCNGVGKFGGTYDLERRGEDVFCSNCGAGPLERTNGTPIEFDYADGKGVFLVAVPPPSEGTARGENR